MWNKKYLWILLPVILVFAGGVFFYYTSATASTEETKASTIQTSVARQGDLTVFASGAGQVVPATEVELGFQSSGTLSELLVNVGDEVLVKVLDIDPRSNKIRLSRKAAFGVNPDDVLD